MTEGDRDIPIDIPAEMLHGNVQRERTRVVTPQTPLPQHVSLYRIAAGGTCTVHVHTGKTETWLVIEGRGEAVVGSSRIPVQSGDFIVTDPGTPHGLVNVGETPLRFVNIVAADDLKAISTTEVEAP